MKFEILENELVITPDSIDEAFQMSSIFPDLKDQDIEHRVLDDRLVVSVQKTQDEPVHAFKIKEGEVCLCWDEGCVTKYYQVYTGDGFASHFLDGHISNQWDNVISLGIFIPEEHRVWKK